MLMRNPIDSEGMKERMKEREVFSPMAIWDIQAVKRPSRWWPFRGKEVRVRCRDFPVTFVITVLLYHFTCDFTWHRFKFVSSGVDVHCRLTVIPDVKTNRNLFDPPSRFLYIHQPKNDPTIAWSSRVSTVLNSV